MSGPWQLAVCATVTILLALTGSSESGASYSLTLSNVFVDIDPKGSFVVGRFNKSRHPGHDADRDLNRVTVSVERVREVGTDGSALPEGGGGGDHALRFTGDDDFALSRAGDDYHGIATVGISCKTRAASTVRSGSVTATAYLLAQAGTIVYGGQLEQVEKGDLKFELVVANWAWCAPCGAAFTGAALEVMLAVESPGRLRVVLKNDEFVTLQMGGGARLTMPRVMTIDDYDQTMPAGYPKVHSATKQLLIFRLPKFSREASFDFTLRPGEQLYPAGEQEEGDEKEGGRDGRKDKKDTVPEVAANVERSGAGVTGSLGVLSLLACLAISQWH